MPKLIVNPDTESAWEIPLKTGANLLGRGPASEFPIAHNSVSDPHCQITVTDDGAAIQDLGSAGGTFLNGEPISTVRLKSGQLIQLGEVLMRFENENATEPLAVSPATEASPQRIYCKIHPKALARHVCRQCGAQFCDLCVSRHSKRGRMAKFCRSCGAECDPVEVSSGPVKAPEIPFARQLSGAFGYPLKGDGMILVVGGSLFLFITDFLARHAFVLGLVLQLFVSGYLISYYQRILLSTATGEDRMPDWPDFSDLNELLSPVFQFMGTLLFSFGPAILVHVVAPGEAAWRPWAVIGLVIVGCLYFPMGFTAVTMADSFSALNPLVIIPSILKIPIVYLSAALVLAAVFGVSWLGESLLPRALPVPVLPDLLSRFIGLYLGIVEMRILGLLYRSRKEQLAWFAT